MSGPFRYRCKLRRGQWQEPNTQVSPLSYRSLLEYLGAPALDPTEDVEEEAFLLPAAPWCLLGPPRSLRLLVSTNGYLGW